MDKDDFNAMLTFIGLVGLAFMVVLMSAAVLGLAVRIFIDVAGL